jgi:hypothetical protein
MFKQDHKLKLHTYTELDVGPLPMYRLGCISRAGQNCEPTIYTVYLVISMPKIPYTTL